jgi:uncharacterized protein YjbI with pentapeptide repeats
MKIQIKSRSSDKILFEGEYNSMKECVVDAVLRGADLRGADLRGADLRCAFLSGADLRGADLRGADLRDAFLRDADLRGADLRDADLRGADLSDADLRGADLRDVPKIENIHQKVYEAASQPDAFDMSEVHTCETTHCRAGWVITLAGESGAAMEYCLGWSAAAALIYLKSDPNLDKIPNFLADNETAMADMKRLADLEKAAFPQQEK